MGDLRKALAIPIYRTFLWINPCGESDPTHSQ